MFDVYVYIHSFTLSLGNPLYIHDTSRAGLNTASCIIHAGTYSISLTEKESNLKTIVITMIPFLYRTYAHFRMNSFSNILQKNILFRPINNNILTLQRSFIFQIYIFSYIFHFIFRNNIFWGGGGINFLSIDRRCVLRTIHLKRN